MKLFGFIFTWVLFVLGHSTFKLLELRDEDQAWVEFWYPIYNFLMIASVDAQGQFEGNLWPWENHDVE
jgi:hypothetical protein